MTRQRTVLFCLLAAIAVGLGYAGFGLQRLEAQAKPEAADTAVAVVNVNDLISKSQMNQDFQERLQKNRAELQQESEEKQKRINVMRQDLDVIPNAVDRQKKEREVIQAMAEYRAWEEIQKQYLVRDQQTFLIKVYDEISRTTKAVAEREGYDVVLLDAPTPNFEELKPEQLVQAIGGRQVIYRSERVDLTSVVLEEMNLKHLNRGND